VRRRFYWLGVVCAIGLVASGVVVGVRGYAKTSGVDGTVRGYFAALARSDAADALAFGDLPAGPHTLLTETVLREQQRIAPLRNLSIVRSRRDANSARVDVMFTLGFAVRDVPVSTTVRLHRKDGGWRLDRVVIPVELESSTARERQSIVGAGIPGGATLMFPGALPIRLDTPYVQLDPERSYVAFESPTTIGVDVEVSTAGRAAVRQAIRAKLRRCLAAAGDPTCPLPDERYVPGSISGTLKDDLHNLSIELASDAVGTFDVDGSVAVSGRYQRLDFRNQPISGHGAVQLSVHATAYAVAPLTVRWTSS
jgi:hypothetical protein